MNIDHLRLNHVFPFSQQLSILKLSKLLQFQMLTTLTLHDKKEVLCLSLWAFSFYFWNKCTTCGATFLSISIHRTSVFKQSFIVSVCSLWNNGSVHVRITGLTHLFPSWTKGGLFQALLSGTGIGGLVAVWIKMNECRAYHIMVKF